MKKTILIISGEDYWEDFLPEFQVVRKRIQDTNWILKKQRLYVSDKNGTVCPDVILWRVGAIRPSAIQTTALRLIALSGTPCVNSAWTLQKGYDRLSMLAYLKQSDLPVIDFDVVSKSTLLKNIERSFPFVVKVGNYHGGYAKTLVHTKEAWEDVKDLLFVTEDYITTEPFINYKRDIRYMAIGDNIWAMSRAGKYWKANVATAHFEQITPDETIANKVKQLQRLLGADIVAVDILEDANDELYVVEYNDVPGLSGFSDALKYELANCVKKQLL